MTAKVNHLENIESLFHSLSDMNLSKAERGWLAVLLACAVNSGIGAQVEGYGAEAAQHADWLATEAKK